MISLVEKFENFAAVAAVEITAEDRKFCNAEEAHLNRFLKHADEVTGLLEEIQKGLVTKRLNDRESIPFDYRYRYFSPKDEISSMKEKVVRVYTEFTKNIVEYFENTYDLDITASSIPSSKTYDVVVNHIIAAIGCSLKDYPINKLKQEITKAMAHTMSTSTGPFEISVSGLSLTYKSKFNEYAMSYDGTDVKVLLKGLSYLVTGKGMVEERVAAAWPGGSRILGWPSTIKFGVAGVKSITSNKNTHTIVFENDEVKNRFTQLFKIR